MPCDGGLTGCVGAFHERWWLDAACHSRAPQGGSECIPENGPDPDRLGGFQGFATGIPPRRCSVTIARLRRPRNPNAGGSASSRSLRSRGSSTSRRRVQSIPMSQAASWTGTSASVPTVRSTCRSRAAGSPVFVRMKRGDAYRAALIGKRSSYAKPGIGGLAGEAHTRGAGPVRQPDPLLRTGRAGLVCGPPKNNSLPVAKRT